MADPVGGNARSGSADDSQVESSVAVAEAAAVFSGDDIEPLVQAIFDAPVIAIDGPH